MNSTGKNEQPNDDVTELLGAYVLDAVDDVERRRVERARENNRQVENEITQLQYAVDALADAVEVEPPASLWQSIQSSIADDHVQSQDKGVPRQSNISGRKTSKNSFYLAAAAILAVVVLSGTVIATLTRSTEPTDSLATMTAMAKDAATKPGSRQAVLTDPERTMEVQVIVDAEGHGFVMTDPLPSLPAGETYQLWSAADGTMISLGMLGSDPKMSLVPIDGSVTELALTREPAQGSVAPTTPPMATGRLV